MAYFKDNDFFLQASLGNDSKYTIIHKYGKNAVVGTTWTFVGSAGVYQTPTAATSLEVLSSSIQDGVGGTGLRTIYVEGIEAVTGNVISETVTMNGTTVVNLVNQYLRVYRCYGVTSGTYSTTLASSQAGTITIRTAGGGATWITIPLDTGLGFGQSLTSGYTVPSGYNWAVYINDISVDSAKRMDVAFFQRDNILDVTSPYTGIMRVQNAIVGVSGTHPSNSRIPIATGTSPIDLGFFAKMSSGTGDISVDYFIVLEQQ